MYWSARRENKARISRNLTRSLLLIDWMLLIDSLGKYIAIQPNFLDLCLSQRGNLGHQILYFFHTWNQVFIL